MTNKPHCLVLHNKLRVMLHRLICACNDGHLSKSLHIRKTLQVITWNCSSNVTNRFNETDGRWDRRLVSKTRWVENDLVPRCRKVVVFLLEGVDSLEAHMQVSWTIKFGKVCHHELWLSHGGRNRFLHTRNIQDSQTGQQVFLILAPKHTTESPSSN